MSQSHDSFGIKYSLKSKDSDEKHFSFKHLIRNLISVNLISIVQSKFLIGAYGPNTLNLNVLRDYDAIFSEYRRIIALS